MSKRARIVTLLIGSFIVLCICVIGYLLLSGVVAITVKSPNQKTATIASVCTTDIVTRYNESANSIITDELSQQKADASVIALTKEIESKDGYLDDPTCVYIGTVGSILAGDATKATQNIDRLKGLVEKGNYVNSSLSGLTSIDALSARVQAMGQPTDINKELGEG